MAKKKTTRKKTKKKKATRKKKTVRKKARKPVVKYKEKTFTGRIGKATWKIKLIVARDGRLVDFTATPTNAAAKRAGILDFGRVVYLAEEHGILVF